MAWEGDLQAEILMEFAERAAPHREDTARELEGRKTKYEVSTAYGRTKEGKARRKPGRRKKRKTARKSARKCGRPTKISTRRLTSVRERERERGRKRRSSRKKEARR
jgi:hypothetical protein